MPYEYIAYTADRRLVKGRIDVDAEETAKETLRLTGYSIVRLKAVGPGLSLHRTMPTLFGVRLPDVIAFSRNLATLIEKGVPAFRALHIIRDQTRSKAFKEVITAIIHDLQQGSSFAESTRKHPQAFPPIYSRMAKVGEQTGNLGTVLRQVSGYMERQRAARKKISVAMVYPAVILVLAAGVVFILITFALPPLIDMFAQFGSELPLATRVLVGFAGFITAFKFHLVAVLVGIAALTVWYVRKPTGRRKLDKLLLRIPLINQIIIGREMSHLSHTMSISLAAGLPMSETMDLVVETTQNTAARKAIEDIRTHIIEGRGLSGTMAEDPLFPPLVVQMVKVGEEAGTLSADMMTVADLYEREVDEKIDFLLSMLQPCLLLFIGLTVAFIAISVIMPIYTMMGAIE